MNDYVAAGKIISVKEAFSEVTDGSDQVAFLDWVISHKNIFLKPSPGETVFIAEIFRTKNFKDMIRKKQLPEGKPVADPFIISSAKIKGYTVVTEERGKPNSAKIPTVCTFYNIPVLNLEGFMTQEGWTF